MHDLCARVWSRSSCTGSGRGPVAAAGLTMMLFGHGVRIAAFVTAGSNFSHLVETGVRLLQLVIGCL